MVLAASVAGATAGMHRMPLKKVPLSEQLVSHVPFVASDASRGSDNLTRATEARRHPATGCCAQPEVHGHPGEVAHGAGLQSTLHRRRQPPGARQQLLERPV